MSNAPVHLAAHQTQVEIFTPDGWKQDMSAAGLLGTFSVFTCVILGDGGAVFRQPVTMVTN